VKKLQFQVTKSDITRYADVSQDRNPIHLDEKYAKGAGFSGKIAHGMLTMAKVISVVSNELLKPSQFIKSYEFSFLAPVYVDEVITMRVVIKGNQYYIDGTCNGKLVVKGIVSL
jgi:3-hydroxybutyryl-CoA dehydratase